MARREISRPNRSMKGDSLSRFPDEHVTDEELHQFAEGDQNPSAATHLQTCSACEARVREVVTLQRRMESLHQQDENGPGALCPDRNVWWKVVEGLPVSEESQALLSHASQCAYCGQALRRTIEDSTADLSLVDPGVEGLPHSGKADLDALAGRLRAAVRTVPIRRSWSRKRVWLAAAAAVIVIGSGIALSSRDPAARAKALLADAYTEDRSTEFRLPGAGYGPVRQERGAARPKSQSLREAEAIIAKGAGGASVPAEWLQVEGRAWLLQWRYDDALAVLRRAQAMAPSESSILGDLAMAHFERAQAGDDPVEYRAALDLLSKAIEREPGKSELRFNQAIVYEHLSDRARAIDEWNEFLRLSPTGGWADEARARLAQLQR